MYDRLGKGTTTQRMENEESVEKGKKRRKRMIEVNGILKKKAKRGERESRIYTE